VPERRPVSFPKVPTFRHVRLESKAFDDFFSGEHDSNSLYQGTKPPAALLLENSAKKTVDSASRTGSNAVSGGSAFSATSLFAQAANDRNFGNRSGLRFCRV
jgi:hypothetical protein